MYFNVREQGIARHVEPVLHVMIPLIVVGSSVLGVVYDLFNPLLVMAGLCWIFEYPVGCTDDPTMDCQRGGGSDGRWVGKFLINGITGLSLLAVLVSMPLICWRVYTRERKMARYGHGAQDELKRTKEVGIRRALGSSDNRVLWLFIRQAFMYLGIGLVLGGGGAAIAATGIETLILGVAAWLPLVFVSVSIGLGLLIFFAAYNPARKLVLIEPGDALHYE